MNSEKLLTALNGIDSKYISEARDALGYRTGEKPRSGHKKLWRTLLIAAVISAFFTAAAAAAGWLGMSGLKIGTSRDTGRTFISIQGFADSKEAKAIAELNEYCESHPLSYKTRDLTEEESLELSLEYGGYFVYTREGYEKVDEICEKYGLRKLGRCTYPDGEKAFYEAAGTGKLTRGHDGCESLFGGGYIYEEGTFDIQGNVVGAELPCSIMYDFRRASKGTLGYVVGQVRDVNMFTEWDYTTSDGVTLHLANSESDNKSDRASFILLDSDDAFYVMSFAHEGYADYLGDGRIDGIGDGFVEFNISNAQLEMLAESFDWLALFDPERGMDGDFRTYSSPNNAASPADTVSLSSEPDFGNVSEEDLYFVKLAYRESIEPCISGFRLIDYCLTGGMNGRDGWVQFSGTPRTKLDWSCTSANGSNVYCRSLNMLSDGRGSWTMGTAYDALPYKPLSNYENIGTEENPDYVYVGCDLSGISSAELYVQQTGRSYTLSADKLSTLELMLRDDGTPGTVSNCNTFNPLWLTLSDGRRTVIYTMGDGSNSYIGGIGSHSSYGLGISIFDLFGVPIDAAGYSESNGLVTARCDGYEAGAWVEYDYKPGGFATERRVHDAILDETRWAAYEFDMNGKLLRQFWHDPDGSLSNTISYEYDEEGRILSESTSNERFWQRVEYIYDSQGRLVMEKSFSDDHPDGNENAFVYYEYDSEGHCRVSHGYERNK